MSEILIRPLSLSDFGDYVGLLGELIGTQKVLDGAAGYEMFRALLRRDGTTILGAEVESRIVSVASLHVHLNMTYGGRPYCLIENVVTRSNYRGRGIGSALMRAAIELAWSENAYKIMLLTGRNYGAKAFYELLGFTDTDKHAMTLRQVPPRG